MNRCTYIHSRPFLTLVNGILDTYGGEGVLFSSLQGVRI